MRKIKLSFESALIMLIVTSCIVGFMAWLWGFTALVALIVPAYYVKKLIEIHRKSAKKIEFMFNALECNDYSFNFDEKQPPEEERHTNILLNKIKEFLMQTRLLAYEKERYYEHIVNNVSTGILIIDKRDNIFQTNKAMMKMVGLDVLTNINQIAKVSQNLADQIKNSHPSESLHAVISNEWGETSLVLTASYINLKGCDLKVVAINNIDELLNHKEVESWGKLTKILTHEIMNSLAPITSLSEALIDMNSDEKLHKGLETIYQTNKSLISFIDNYRRFTKIQQPIKTPFEIKPLIEKLSPIVIDNDVTFLLSVEPSNTMLYADENQIFQVLVNILKNAVQATTGREDRRVSVDVYIREDENIVIDIANNGASIDSGAIENIFIPFFTTKSNGRGIGLAISKQIIQLHNGSLSVSCNHDGKVVFSILLK